MAKEEELGLEELIGWILFKYKLEEEGLAELFNVHPTTIYKWIEGRPMDLSCAETLLGLLQYHGEEIFPLLVERLENPSLESWPERIAKVRGIFGPTTTALARFLGTDYHALMRWTRGVKSPGSCYAVMIDLLYRHPREMDALLRKLFPEPSDEPWVPERLVELATALRMTVPELAMLLQMHNSTVRGWFAGISPPGTCAQVLLGLLEEFPERVGRMLQRLPRVSRGDWPPERYIEARENAGLTRLELEDLTGIGFETIRHMEVYGVTRTDCPAVLYGLLEASPPGMIRMLKELQEVD